MENKQQTYIKFTINKEKDCIDVKVVTQKNNFIDTFYGFSTLKKQEFFEDILATLNFLFEQNKHN